MRTLVHLSDLHFGRIDTALLGPLRTAVLGTKPDLIAISGDFTQRARRSEFAEARRFLASLDAPKLTVPGNHDVPLFLKLPEWFKVTTPLGNYNPDWAFVRETSAWVRSACAMLVPNRSV